MEVKKEVYGSRPSILEGILRDNGVKYLKHTWLITCRGMFNMDSNTRYLFICEFFNLNDLRNAEFPTNLFNERMIRRVFGVFVDETKEVIYWKSGYGDVEKYSYDEYIKLVAKLTECKYLESFAKGSEHSTPFSRFFRENMGKGFALTDIDFILPDKNILIEEKTFIKNWRGYLGWGQCLSLKELRSDVLNESVKMYLVFVDRSNDLLYVVEDINSIDCSKTAYLENWGSAVPVELKKPIPKEQFIELISG